MLPEYIPIWHWFVLSLILFGFEMLGAAGFLLGLGTAAALTGTISSIMPELKLFYQLIMFSIFSVVFSLGLWLFFKKQQDCSPSTLNNRAAQMIGKTALVKETMVNCSGRVQFGDTFWKVRANENISAGTTVVVTGSSDGGMLLQVRAL